jgi:hypothetical protein
MIKSKNLCATVLAVAGLVSAAALERAWASSDSIGSGAVRVEHITDPTLNNMVAFDIRVPAKWHYQGTLAQGGPCVGIPSQVFRLTSPDGLSFVERFPALGWSWATGGAAGKIKTPDCLPLNQKISAQDFLKYFASTLNVEYVGDDPIPAEARAAAQHEVDEAAKLGPANNGGRGYTYHQTIDLASAIIRYKNGSFTMKGQLQTSILCGESHYPGVKSMLRGVPDQPDWGTTQCGAGVRYTVAPEDRIQATLDAMIANRIGAAGNPTWNQAWIERTQRQGAAFAQQLANQNQNQNQGTSILEAGARSRAAGAAQFNQDQASRQRMHEQFLSTMQRGTTMSMQSAAQVANSNHTITSNWVDYSLDRQTVRDPGTGQISKVTSGYNATWVDNTGKVSFQTSDPNANPNGSLPGTWTRQQVVNGDGTAR